MSRERLSGLVSHNLRLLAVEPGPILAMTIMPLFMITFLQGMGRTALESGGYDDVSGAEQVVPGMAALFSLFGVVYLGIAFYQEHGWGTWDRLRMSPASTAEILLAKLAPSGLVILGQTVALFGLGALLFGLDVRGSLFALLAMMLASTVMLVAISMLAVAVFRSINQLSAATNVGAMLFGGLGGTIAPLDTLPGWAQTLAPISPAYWSMRGYTTVVLDGGGLADIVRPLSVIGVVSIAAAVLSAWRFRLAEPKDWT